MDSTPANDLPHYDGLENTSPNTRLGNGPAIYVMDRGTIGDQRLIRWLVASAEADAIPLAIPPTRIGWNRRWRNS